MSSKTRIVVLKMKELIYTAVFLGLAVVLITLFLIMFRPRQEDPAPATWPASYIPGVYSASLTLGSQNLNVEVAVDADKIQSVSFVSLDEAVTTMYPLMQPALDNISQQVYEKQSVENITYDEANQYTSVVLLNAIKDALSRAEAQNEQP